MSEVRRLGAMTEAALKLATDIIVGVLLFSAITIAMAGLHLLLLACETYHLGPPALLAAMRKLEFIPWIAEATCFVWLVAISCWRFCLTLWREREAFDS